MDLFLKNDIILTHATAATFSVSVATALTYPLDTLKTLIQVGSTPANKLTATQVFGRVSNLSGYPGLYSGFGWLAFGRTSSLGARFGIYELLTAFYKDGREDGCVHVSDALMAGMAAGAMESILSSPFELIKLRAQVTSASRIPDPIVSDKRPISPLIAKLLRGYTPDVKAMNYSVGLLSTLPTKHHNLMHALQQYPWMMTGSGKPPPVYHVRRLFDIASLEGFGAFWRGFRSGIVRDSIFGGMFFSSWQFLYTAMLNWKAVGMNPPPRSDQEIGPLSPLAVSLAAGFSGSLAAAGSHCFDTAKSRSQCIVLPKYVSMERKLIRWTLAGSIFERATGIHPSDRNILFRGIWLRMARSGISSFMIVGSYFWIVDHLISR